MRRYTVLTDRGAFIIHELTPERARAKMRRAGRKVLSVKERGYEPPRKPSADHL